MIGQSLRRLIPAEHESDEDDIIARISAGELIQSYETVRLLKKGHKVDVSITVSPIRDQTGKVIGASTIARDITERKRAEERQQTLMSELDHRVRNTLARLRAVIERSREGAVTADGFASALDQRLEAMARTHARFSSHNWTGTGLKDLAEDELDPYRSAHKISIQGPEVSLSPAAAQSISVVLHELTTNAAKYGSLSVIEGRLSLTWGVRCTDDGTGSLDILWQETCGPRVSSAVRPGFGSLVIRRQLKHELSANVNWIPAPEGVRCEISIPLERVRGDA
jgi:two-component sensor histidine kinase